MSKQLQFSRKYVLILAAIAVAILFGGALLKPERRASIEKVSEQERSRLQRIVRRRSVEEIGEFIAEAAVRASAHVVYSGLTQSSGVIYGTGGRVVAAAPGKPVEGSDTLLAGESKLAAEAQFARPDLPFAVLKLKSPPEAAPRTLSLGALQLGQWLVAVWRVPGGSLAFAHGMLGGSASAACGKASLRTVTFGADIPKVAEGGGVFDLDGALVAFLVHCEDTLVAALPESVASYMVAAPSADDLLANRFGIAVEPKDQDQIVSTIWPGYPGALAGLQVGDVVQGAPDWSATVAQELRVTRAGRPLRIPWPYKPAPAPPSGEVRP